MRHLLYVDPDDDFVHHRDHLAARPAEPGARPLRVVRLRRRRGRADRGNIPRAGALLEPLGTRTIRAGELAELDLGGPIFHRVSNRTAKPLVTLHVYGVAADNLTTGINRIYGEE